MGRGLLVTDSWAWGVCREKAKGATFFEATEGETVRPMLDVSWAPMLGAFSVVFEEFHDGAPRARPVDAIDNVVSWRGRFIGPALASLVSLGNNIKPGCHKPGVSIKQGSSRGRA